MKNKDPLDIKIHNYDGTLRDYLRELLTTLWTEGECFSGKRPLGNSGWDYDVYYTLVENGFIEGTIEDGCVEDINETGALLCVLDIIEDLFKEKK